MVHIKKKKKSLSDSHHLWNKIQTLLFQVLQTVPCLHFQSSPNVPRFTRCSVVIKYKHDFFGRNDAEAGTPVLWPPHVKTWLIGKDSDAGRDWGQEEKGTTEDEMAGWHPWLDGRESEWTPGVGDGQGGLVCCDSWGCKELDMTERLIWSDLIWSDELESQKFSICLP